MAKPPNPTQWLAGFVSADPPRGESAVALARSLVGALGDPHHHAPSVHIVGTAGKGTVASRLTDRLVGAGLRVATHQSPHVYDVRERFLLDGELPSWSLVEAAIEEVERGLVALRRDHDRNPTYFAVTAALSWVIGRAEDADVFVTEAGIGGRHDATAVLRRPDTLTVITHIGLDHTEVLGPDVVAIATEKAAVLAGRRTAVLGPQTDPAATRVVRDVAAAAGVDLHVVEGGHRDFRAEADATVARVADVLADTLGRPIPACPSKQVPGRYEVRSVAGRRIVLDGAHNPDKLRALARVVSDDVRPGCVVAALARTKDLAACAGELTGLGAPVVAVPFGEPGQPGPVGHPATDVAAAVAAAGGVAQATDTVADGVRRAIDLTAPHDTVLVTGSFLILADAAEAFTAVG